MPTKADFQRVLDSMFTSARAQGLPYLDVRALDLHQRIGEYPDGQKHRMPVCCGVMRRNMREGDMILKAPPKGDGANLLIRYLLPR